MKADYVRQDALSSHLRNERMLAQRPNHAELRAAAKARTERIRRYATRSGLRERIDALYEDGRVPDEGER